MTIVEAAIAVLKAGDPTGMALRDVYDQIIAGGLYTFNSDRPICILGNQMKRATTGISWATTANKKVFRLVGNRFSLLPSQAYSASSNHASQASEGHLAQLRGHYAEYCAEFRARLLSNLRELDPYAFEAFARKLLEAYGFTQVTVTQASSDGGIDGHGKLEVGLAQMNVAFQCKHWRGTVGQPEVDKFRGAIQGQFEQGVFLTTSSFTKPARDASLRPGAVPVVLLDGPKIADLMIEREFGVQVEYLKVYEYALDEEIG